jgi:hypothetical protein
LNDLRKQNVSIASMTTDVPNSPRELPDLPSTSQVEVLQSTATDACSAVGKIALDKTVRVTAAFAMGGAAVFGTWGGASGLVTGGALGALAGIPPAPFTFGLSVPFFAAIGSGCGLTTGTVVGGTIGLISGGAVGRKVCAKQDKEEGAHGK